MCVYAYVSGTSILVSQYSKADDHPHRSYLFPVQEFRCFASDGHLRRFEWAHVQTDPLEHLSMLSSYYLELINMASGGNCF